MQRLGKAFCALAAGLAVAASLVSRHGQHAQTWPQRPVRFIVSLGPGSGADIGARLIADKLTAKWKQPVVVENRPGGDAVVAINAFIGAKDDHTLLYTPTSSFTAHPFQMAKLPYDPNDLGPVARVSNTLVGLVVPPSLKINTVKDFIAQVKAQPGKLNYATATGMTDVIFDGYFKSAGLNITRVPYRDVVRAAHRCRRGPHPGLCRRARDRAAACPGRPRQADRRHQQPARADASRIRRRSRRRASPS